MLQLSVHSEAQRTEWLWIVQVADRSGKYIYIYGIYIYIYIYGERQSKREQPDDNGISEQQRARSGYFEPKK